MTIYAYKLGTITLTNYSTKLNTPLIKKLNIYYKYLRIYIINLEWKFTFVLFNK